MIYQTLVFEAIFLFQFLLKLKGIFQTTQKRMFLQRAKANSWHRLANYYRLLREKKIARNITFYESFEKSLLNLCEIEKYCLKLKSLADHIPLC